MSTGMAYTGTFDRAGFHFLRPCLELLCFQAGSPEDSLVCPGRRYSPFHLAFNLLGQLIISHHWHPRTLTWWGFRPDTF